MPYLRKLLPEEFEIRNDYSIFNCVNGRLIENTTICICYPGWTTNENTLNQCDIDSGENTTNSNSVKNNGVVYYDTENNNNKSTSPFVIGFYVVLIILALGLICALFLCLFKKYKDIRLIKEKIKFEKKKNKKIGDKNKDNKGSEEKTGKKESISLDILNESSIDDAEDNNKNEEVIDKN